MMEHLNLTMKNEIVLSEKQIDTIGHSLGINVYNARLSDNPKFKFLPNEFYRNYYCVGNKNGFNEDMKYLEEIEFIEKWMHGNQLYFEITKKGIEYFKDYFIREITCKRKPISKSSQKYNDYLDADCGENFKEYLGIEMPEREYSKEGVRLVSTKYNNVKGDFSKTLKDAKSSYKASLKNYLKTKNEGV